MTVMEFRAAIREIPQDHLRPEDRFALQQAIHNVSMYRVVGKVDEETVRRIQQHLRPDPPA